MRSDANGDAVGERDFPRSLGRANAADEDRPLRDGGPPADLPFSTKKCLPILPRTDLAGPEGISVIEVRLNGGFRDLKGAALMAKNHLARWIACARETGRQQGHTDQNGDTEE